MKISSYCSRGQVVTTNSRAKCTKLKRFLYEKRGAQCNYDLTVGKNIGNTIYRKSAQPTMINDGSNISFFVISCSCC